MNPTPLANWIQRSIPSFRQVVAIVCTFALLVGTTTAVFAQEDHLGHPSGEAAFELSLSEALERGAARGPLVEIAKAPTSAAREALKKSNPWTTQLPVLQAQFGPRWSRGVGLPEVIVTVLQPISIFDQGKAQQGVARAQVELVDFEVADARAENAQLAAQAWLDLIHADRLLEIRAQAHELVEKVLKIAQVRYALGEVDASEPALVQADSIQIQSEIMAAEELHFIAATRLAYLTGEPIGTQLESKLSSFEEIENDLNFGRSSASQHPTLRLANARSELARTQVGYQKAQQSPVLSVGVQYQREGTGDQILTGVLSVPLAFTRPWSYQESAQRVQHERSVAHADSVKQELSLTLRQAIHEKSHAEQRYQLLNGVGMTAQLEALRVLMKQYQAGAVDLSRVSWAQKNLLLAKEQLLQAEFDLHGASVRLLKAQGKV